MNTGRTRLYMLDLIKVMTLFAIQTLHAWEFVFYEDNVVLPGSIAYNNLQYYARFFSLGGQVLVAVIYLLFGLQQKSRASLIRIAGFAILGQLALMFAFMENGILSFEWDIYSYIFLSNLLLLAFPRGSWAVAVVSFLLLWVPPAFWQEHLPSGEILNVITGREGKFSTGAWAPLPWFFHALLFFNLGSLIAEKKLRLHLWEKAETFVWPILFFFSLPFLGYYFWTPIGPRYYQFNFHQSPWIYWANFLPFVFWIRIAFLTKVQERLSQSRKFRWISGLKWSTHLGPSYVIAVLYTGFMAMFDEYFRAHPLWFDAFYLSIMPVTEVTVRIFVKIKELVFRKYQ